MATITAHADAVEGIDPGAAVGFTVAYKPADADVTWYRTRVGDEDESLAESESVSLDVDTGRSTLTVTDVDTEDEARYYAEVTDPDGDGDTHSEADGRATVTSDPAALRLTRPADNLTVGADPPGDSVSLATTDSTTPVVVDESDATVVDIVASAFAADLGAVTGSTPEVVTDLPDSAEEVVIAGSTTESDLVGELIAREAFDPFHVAHGQWEAYTITTVTEPFEGIDRALVVAGSDPRGTAYGLYELSERAGVSPWTWWADVPADETDAVRVTADQAEFGPPDVKYRGIFVNDEQWGLRPWATETFEPEFGNIGPRTYERVFELLLRLKANHVWPAMHPGTAPFYAEPRKMEVADDYAINVGTSHTEVMLFNNEEEWDSVEDGPWDYTQNADRIREVWEQRVEETADTENVYQVGIRGQHDTEMEGVDSDEEAAELLAEVIADQRAMLAEHVGEDVTDVPQVFTPYKEVLDMYEAGLEVPDDVTLMWVDDNYGYIRRFSDEQEQLRSGGSGVYYHLSYLGLPHPYLWCDSLPPTMTWRELNRAYEHDMRDNWVVNVGDIKRREWGTEYFLDLGWDIDSWDHETTIEYLEHVAARDIGAEYAAEVSDLLWEYYDLAAQRRPTFMGFSFHWFGEEEPEDPDFSLWNYGDEVTQRIERVRDLRDRTGALLADLDSEHADAFFELVYFPIATGANINLKQLHAYKSREYAAQDRVDANHHADRAMAEYDRYRENVRRYNEDVAGGKWDGIVERKPGMGGGAEVYDEPEVARIDVPGEGGFDVAIEGSKTPLSDVEAEGPRPAERIARSVADATLSGDHVTRGEDERGHYVAIPEGTDVAESEDGDTLPENGATFEVTVESGGRYELTATVDNYDEEFWSWDSIPWKIRVDGEAVTDWNEDVGAGTFWITDLDLEPGSHTLTFRTGQTGSKLRGVGLVGQRTNAVPPVTPGTDTKRFVDVFNTGENPVEWTAEASDDWLTLRDAGGRVADESDRLWVSVDADRAPAGATGHVEVTDGERTERVYVPVASTGPTTGSDRQTDATADRPSHVEQDGVVAARAENYRDRQSGAVADWQQVEHLGPTGTAMVLDPLTDWYVEDIGAVPTKCPALDYEVVVTEGGGARLTVESVASFPVEHGTELRTAVSVDGGDPEWVTFQMGPAESRNWKANVAENRMAGALGLDLEPGIHTIRVWGTDPSINLTRLTLDFGGQRQSYLGPPETRLVE